jgi:hypothetical protein
VTGLSGNFSRRLDRPLEECLAALERWAAVSGQRPVVRSGPADGAPPVRYRVALRPGVLGRRVPVEVRVGHWAGAATTHLELVTTRTLAPTARRAARCRHLLDELAAACSEVSPIGSTAAVATPAGRSRPG